MCYWLATIFLVLWGAFCYLMATSWTLMLSWAILSSSSGSLIFKKRGRSSTSQLMSRRCNKQVCTHDRAGSRALERRIGFRRLDQEIKPLNPHTESLLQYRVRVRDLLFIQITEALYCLHQHEHQLMIGLSHIHSQLLPSVWQLREIPEERKNNILYMFFWLKLIRAARYGCTGKVELPLPPPHFRGGGWRGRDMGVFVNKKSHVNNRRGLEKVR